MVINFQVPTLLLIKARLWLKNHKSNIARKAMKNSDLPWPTNLGLVYCTVVAGFRAFHGFRALCTRNQIWIYVTNLPRFSPLPGFKAPFYGDGQSALNSGTTYCIRVVVERREREPLMGKNTLFVTRPGIASGGIKKLIQDTTTNLRLGQ